MEIESASRLLGACVVIGVVLYGLRTVARALRRTAALARPGGRIVAILETTALPSGASLHVVRVAERYYLIGRGAAALATLCEIPPENFARAPAAAERPARRCATLERWLTRVRGSAAARA